MKENKHILVKSEEQLFDEISRLIDESRKQVAKTLNTAMVYTYYGIGQYIVEFEQGGKERAAYGKEVLKRLSARLTEQYGKGWSEDNLENCRKLFLNYSITEPMVRKSHTLFLPWSHYLILMREKNPQARKFYEIEAYNHQWSKRQLPLVC